MRSDDGKHLLNREMRDDGDDGGDDGTDDKLDSESAPSPPPLVTSWWSKANLR